MKGIYPKNLIGLAPGGYTDAEGFDDIAFDDERIGILVEICKKYLKRSKTINDSFTSYGLKHIVERFCKYRYPEEIGNYVQNGEVIYAMSEAGFRIRRSGRNAFFNCSPASYAKFCKLAEEQERLFGKHCPL